MSGPGQAAGERLRISMIGQRGVPATYGGIERHVEELGARLADRGHDVTVWCRTSYVGEQPTHLRGMRLRYLPALRSRGLESISHSALAVFCSLWSRPDVVHFHGVGSVLLAPLSRWVGRSGVVATVHGLDGDRAKWGRVAKAVLTLGTRMSASVPHATIVVSRALAAHFRSAYGSEATHIGNGVSELGHVPAGATLDRLGLTADRYVLYVGRVVPEKAPHQLVRAFLAREVSLTTQDVKLAIVGGTSHTDEYVAQVQAASAGDPRVVHAGYVYGEDLHELYGNAGLFVLPSLVEGLPLTLLEACAHGVPVLCSDIPPHLEVVDPPGAGGGIYPAGDEEQLTACLEQMLRGLGSEEQRRAATEQRERVLRRYSWDDMTSDTEAVYQRVVSRSAAPGSRVRRRLLHLRGQLRQATGVR